MIQIQEWSFSLYNEENYILVFFSHSEKSQAMSPRLKTSQLTTVWCPGTQLSTSQLSASQILPISLMSFHLANNMQTCFNISVGVSRSSRVVSELKTNFHLQAEVSLSKTLNLDLLHDLSVCSEPSE